MEAVQGAPAVSLGPTTATIRTTTTMRWFGAAANKDHRHRQRNSLPPQRPPPSAGACGACQRPTTMLAGRTTTTQTAPFRALVRERSERCTRNTIQSSDLVVERGTPSLEMAGCLVRHQIQSTMTTGLEWTPTPCILWRVEWQGASERGRHGHRRMAHLPAYGTAGWVMASATTAIRRSDDVHSSTAVTKAVVVAMHTFNKHQPQTDIMEAGNLAAGCVYGRLNQSVNRSVDRLIATDDDNSLRSVADDIALLPIYRNQQ